jgi:hypothetical protein
LYGYTVEGVSDDEWNLTLAKVACNAFVRPAKSTTTTGGDGSTKSGGSGEGGEGEDPSAAAVTVAGGSNGKCEKNEKKKKAAGAGAKGGGPGGFVVRLFAHVSVCNHSCRPNAAVSVSDDLVTLYTLRTIRPGEAGLVQFEHS